MQSAVSWRGPFLHQLYLRLSFSFHFRVYVSFFSFERLFCQYPLVLWLKTQGNTEERTSSLGDENGSEKICISIVPKTAVLFVVWINSNLYLECRTFRQLCELLWAILLAAGRSSYSIFVLQMHFNFDNSDFPSFFCSRWPLNELLSRTKFLSF